MRRRFGCIEGLLLDFCNLGFLEWDMAKGASERLVVYINFFLPARSCTIRACTYLYIFIYILPPTSRDLISMISHCRAESLPP